MRGLCSTLTVGTLVAISISGSKSAADVSARQDPEQIVQTQGESPNHRRASVLADLARLEKEENLTIAWVENGLQVATFDHRSQVRSVPLPLLSPKMPGAVSLDGVRVAGEFLDGSRRLTLGIIGYDGSNPREYPGIAPVDFCWSHDNASIALTNSQGGTASLQTLSVNTKATRIIKANVEERWHLTSQCWSPDDKQILFENDGTVQIYDIRSGKTIELVNGTNPTWSPDGEWIAFRDHDTYYAIRPNGRGKRELFHKKSATSGLYWSPDSRFVAYVSLAGILEGGVLPDVETYRLRVRRLQDNSEDWVVNGASCCINYQWETNNQILSYVQSQTAPK